MMMANELVSIASSSTYTSSQDQLLHRSSRIMRLVRKTLNLTQEEMAKELQITQSCLSKFEASRLGPSAIQWMTFCKRANIQPDCIFTGVIDGLNAKSLRRQVGKLPFRRAPHYLSAPLISVRLLRPLLDLIEQQHSKNILQSVLKQLNTDAELLLFLDEYLSWQFVIDLCDALERRKLSLPNLWQCWSPEHFGDHTLGDLFTELTKKKQQWEKVSVYLDHMFKDKSISVKMDIEHHQQQIKLSLPHFWGTPGRVGERSPLLEDLLHWELKHLIHHDPQTVLRSQFISHTPAQQHQDIIFSLELGI